jgi:plastocyanin
MPVSRRIVALSVLALVLSATAVRAADAAVSIADFSFSPSTVTVNVGDTVTWTNSDQAPHTATANDGSFNTGSISNGSSDSVTFDTAGTFPYHCTIHPTMSGTVVVQGATGTTPPTDAAAFGGNAMSTAPSLALPAILAVACSGFLLARRHAARR